MTIADAEFARALARGQKLLSEPVSKQVLSELGIKVPRSALVADRESVASAISKMRAPFALKVVCPTVSHKSELGGVLLNVSSVEQVLGGIKAIAERFGRAGHRPESYLLEEMVDRGTEIVIGGLFDNTFGPAVMIGVGGIFIELLDDVAFRLCPISHLDAIEMISELRASAIFYGARGREAVNIESVVDVLIKIGGDEGLMTQRAHQVDSIDLNPVIASAAGCVAVDARIVLRTNDGKTHERV